MTFSCTYSEFRSYASPTPVALSFSFLKHLSYFDLVSPPQLLPDSSHLPTHRTSSCLHDCSPKMKTKTNQHKPLKTKKAKAKLFSPSSPPLHCSPSTSQPVSSHVLSVCDGISLTKVSYGSMAEGLFTGAQKPGW